jgi:hypothetical protein
VRRAPFQAKITENEAAATALKVTKSPLLAASSSNVPDLVEARARLAQPSRLTTGAPRPADGSATRRDELADLGHVCHPLEPPDDVDEGCGL